MTASARAVDVAGSGRRRQAKVPWHARVQRDLIGWGVVAAIAAGLVLGLSGGGWVKAAGLAVLVLLAFAVLAVLTARSSPDSSSGSSSAAGSGLDPQAEQRRDADDPRTGPDV